MAIPTNGTGVIDTGNTPVALIRRNLPGFKGCTHLYQVLERTRLFKVGQYFVASASTAYGKEVYLFRAKADGTVTSWAQLPGSQKDTLNVNRVVKDAGYIVVGSTD
jgi:hypothetical protein